LQDDVDNGTGAWRRRLYNRALSYSDWAAGTLASAYGGNKALAYLAGSAYGPVSARVADYAQNLAPHDAVVIWLPLETCTEAFVIGPSGISWHTLPIGRQALRAKVVSIRRAIQSAVSSIRNSTRPSVANFPAEDARTLYHTLFDPLQADLRAVTHLFAGQL